MGWEQSERRSRTAAKKSALEVLNKVLEIEKAGWVQQVAQLQGNIHAARARRERQQRAAASGNTALPLSCRRSSGRGVHRLQSLRSHSSTALSRMVQSDDEGSPTRGAHRAGFRLNKLKRYSDTVTPPHTHTHTHTHRTATLP